MKPKPRKTINSTDSGITTGDNYAKKAQEFCKRSGSEAFPVIIAGSPEWANWMEYFNHISSLHCCEGSFVAERGKMTVPCLSPDEFDQGWRSTPPVDRPPVAGRQDHVKYADSVPDSRWRVQQMTDAFKRGAAAEALNNFAKDHCR